MKKVLLAAAALALTTAPAAASNYGPGSPKRGARKTAVSHVGRSSGNAGSSGGATYYGTAPQNTRSSMEDQAMKRMMAPGGSDYSTYSGRTSGYTRGVSGGGLGGGSRLTGSRRLGEGGLPDVVVPGQLYRSAGLGFVHTAPETPPTTFAVQAGDRIKYDDMPGGYAITTHKQIFHGPKDTPPPPNPMFGTASGNTGISENAPVSGGNTTIIQKGRNTIGGE